MPSLAARSQHKPGCYRAGVFNHNTRDETWKWI